MQPQLMTQKLKTQKLKTQKLNQNLHLKMQNLNQQQQQS